MSASLLGIRKLTLNRNGRCLIDEISLDIDSAEVYALVGGNGCGKTSLAKAIMGCEGYAADSGVYLAGKRIDALPLEERARRGITMAW